MDRLCWNVSYLYQIYLTFPRTWNFFPTTILLLLLRWTSYFIVQMKKKRIVCSHWISVSRNMMQNIKVWVRVNIFIIRKHDPNDQIVLSGEISQTHQPNKFVNVFLLFHIIFSKGRLSPLRHLKEDKVKHLLLHA